MNEREIRRNLAACYRLFVKFGWTDLIFTHLSARVPDHPDQYLINPYGLLFHEVTASNLLKVDFDGHVISGDYPFNAAGHSIHTAVLKHRPDVNVVLHSHTRAGMAVSCMKAGLLPLTQQANEIRDITAYHRYSGIASEDEEECRLLGKDLGKHWLMILHNHGLLSVGRTLPEAFYLLYYLEHACKVQVDVLGSGLDHITPDDTVIAELAEYGRPHREGPIEDIGLLWSALIRMLDSEDSSYKD